MKLDNSNKRYSTIFAGILAILAVSIFLVLFIGCGDNNIYQQDEAQIRFSGICLDSEKHCLTRDIGKNKNVPVAQGEDWCELTASTGLVDFSTLKFDYNSNGLDTEDFEFNIDGTYTAGPNAELPTQIIDDLSIDTYLGEPQLTDWYMDATVWGGYTPVQSPYWLSGFDIYQKKEVQCGPDIETFMGKVYIHWEQVVDPSTGDPLVNPDGSTEWIAHFMVENAAPTNDVILLESSESPGGQCLGKTYNIVFYSTWTGCEEVIQNFEYILAQKCLYFRSPQLPISSPVE